MPRNRKACPDFYGVSFLRNPVKLLRSILARGQYAPESDRKSYIKGSVSAGMPCSSYAESNSASLNNRRNQGVSFLRCMHRPPVILITNNSNKEGLGKLAIITSQIKQIRPKSHTCVFSFFPLRFIAIKIAENKGVKKRKKFQKTSSKSCKSIN